MFFFAFLVAVEFCFSMPKNGGVAVEKTCLLVFKIKKPLFYWGGTQLTPLNKRDSTATYEIIFTVKRNARGVLWRKVKMTKKVKEVKSIGGVPEGIPPNVETIIACQVNRAARHFRLCELEREELTSHIRSEVMSAIQTKYDSKRANVCTFAHWVAKNCLCKWIKAEVKRRKHFVSMTPELEARIAELPAPDPAHDAALLRIARVRQTVAALPPLYRRICELYMQLGTLEKVQQALHKSSRDFYGTIWPRCQDAFKKIFEKSGK